MLNLTHQASMQNKKMLLKHDKRRYFHQVAWFQSNFRDIRKTEYTSNTLKFGGIETEIESNHSVVYYPDSF